ncbi:hypothetical protein V9T40_006274 [Parthenolecanium corni]|uniref:Uncharacterized protein n=1 Tax=Parthenolecanium corni TaxID=536013 RepID=A0AAN9Y5E4_9HEMI
MTVLPLHVGDGALVVPPTQRWCHLSATPDDFSVRMLQPLIAEIEALSVPPTKRLCHLAAAPDVRTFLVSEIFVQGSTEMTVLYSSIPELSSLTS